MRPPFPGMDPFVEGQEWDDFQGRFLYVLTEMLTERIAPRYVARVERRVLVDEEEPLPVPGSHPVVQEQHDPFIMIRHRESMEVVTVIEVLLPDTKRAVAHGESEYLRKRETMLLSEAHLVELDLLRGGDRLPALVPLPAGDYYAHVSRAEQRPEEEIHFWDLHDRLPILPVPLTPGDPDVPLDLQAAFEVTYARARYEMSIDYTAPVDPPLPARDAALVARVLAQLRVAPHGQ